MIVRNPISISQQITFGTAIFLSAFLLFLIQPLEGNILLPLFGGAPSVWVVTLVFYQTVLFFGYLAAHLLSRLPSSWALILHLLFILIACTLLQLTPSDASLNGSSPEIELLQSLIQSVGLPFFLLSMTSPLLQKWLFSLDTEANVYKLYAVSNAGSLMALLIYPLICEPYLGLSLQAKWWSVLFILWAVTCAVCAISSRQSNPVEKLTPAQTLAPQTVPQLGLFYWLGLSACSSMFLTSITNLMCNQLSSLPFVFILPLAIYLLTFIIAFSNRRVSAPRSVILISIAGSLLIACYYLRTSSIFFQSAFVYSILLGAVCSFCHLTLYRSRPSADRLTHFYVAISGGSALGSLLTALAAPLLFTRYYELPLSFLLFGLLLCSALRRQSGINNSSSHRILTLSVNILFLFILPALTLNIVRPPGEHTILEGRNFFGRISVSVRNRDNPEKLTVVAHHGMTIHGAQRMDNLHRLTPITYFGKGSGLAATFEALNDLPTLKVGAVGLSTGCLVSYRGAGDEFRFYEINQLAIDIAKTKFTFLQESPAKSTLIVGDARLQLDREPPQNFDLLVLDAFIGGSVPVHLLTEEAFPIYLKHLREQGIVAIHISNHFLNLQAVVAGLAKRYNLSMATITSNYADEYILPSKWVVLSRDPQYFQRQPFLKLRSEGSLVDGHSGVSTLWTDDFHNLIEVINW